MNLELTGKVALVTGASKGIGRAIAVGLGAEGTRLAIVARTPTTLDDAASAAKASGAQDVMSIAADRARVVDEDVDSSETLDGCVDDALDFLEL